MRLIFLNIRIVICLPEWRSMCERLATAEQSLTQRDEEATRLAARSARILTIVGQLVRVQAQISTLACFLHLPLRQYMADEYSEFLIN